MEWPDKRLKSEFKRKKNKLKLTNKQRKFAELYILHRQTLTDAYCEAFNVKRKYYHSSAASTLKKHPPVKRYIKELQKSQRERALMSSDEIIQALEDVALRCMQAEPVMFFNKEGKRWEETGEYKFDSPGANKALDTLVKIHGLAAPVKSEKVVEKKVKKKLSLEELQKELEERNIPLKLVPELKDDE